VYNIYKTIPPLDTTWYTIWAKVIVIVATYRRVVTGIVLDKLGKPDYRTPSSFRIIVLVETISKILERHSAVRLESAARSLAVLHPN